MAARLTTYLVVGIVAATLIAGLIVGAQRDDSEGPVDLIVHNAVVYTGDDETMAEAVAIRGNQVLRVGSNREITRLRRPQTTMIDAGGAAVLPGFNDGAVRLVEGGLALREIDLLGARTSAEIFGRIRTWASANPNADWVLGRGWSPAAGEGEVTRQELDAIVADRPVFLLSETGDEAWVNSRTLAVAGVTAGTRDPGDGAVVRDRRTGEPTGLLTGSAVQLASKHVPRPTRDDRAAALRDAIDEAHRLGITSVQDVGATTADVALYDELRKTDDLDLRVYAALAVETPADERALARLEAVWRQYSDDPRLKTGAVAIELDGRVEEQAAALLSPYRDTGSGGESRLAADDLNRLARLLDAQGWQVLTRATGDRAVRMALDAYRHAARSNPVPERGRRHRIDGLALVDPADVPRFDALDVLASTQPFFLDPSPARLVAWNAILGPERALAAWPLKTLAARGTRVVFGSGWPTAPLNPMLGLHTAVTRTTMTGQPENGWTPGERISLATAIDAYTSQGAFASFDEQRKGTIATGMLADLVVLSNDIFDTPPARLAGASVAVTIFDGRIVYRREARATN